jgi:hypothetical protein
MALDNYIGLVLKNLNLPVTQNRVNLLKAWAALENTKAKNNYFATTWNAEPSRTDKYLGGYYFNTNNNFPVKNYSTETIGAKAFANTLIYGNYYPKILAGLKSDLDINNWYNAAVENEFTLYGGGGGYGQKILKLWDQFKNLKVTTLPLLGVLLGAFFIYLAIKK